MRSADARARAAYDVWHMDRTIDLEANAPWHILVKAYFTSKPPAGDLLEIACGRGELSTWLAGNLPVSGRRIAADFSATAVRRARQTLIEQGIASVSCAMADIQALPFTSGSFDVVVSCETIEHVPEPALAVEELARVLRRGGRLVLTTPNYLGPIGLYRGYMRLTGRRYTETGQPVNRLVTWPRTWRWFRRAGLSVVYASGSGHYLPFPGRPPVRWRLPDHAAWITRWFALHSLIVGRKP
jgi:2-polyprenyl-3-methyl-5-hydroxy-6-metoxy-1,4-benzoquinol methylase